MRIIIVLILIGMMSCRKTKITSSYIVTRDSVLVAKQVRIDTVDKYVEIKTTDTFANAITLKEPCDSTGKLKNGFRQVFTNGSFSAEVQIDNNEIKVHFRGSKTECRNETNRAISIQVDSLDKKVSHFVKTDKKVDIEKGSSIWERFQNIILHIAYILGLIAMWEYAFKPFLKLIKTT